MNYIECTSKKYLSKDAEYAYKTLIEGYGSEYSDVLCSVLALISDYDATFEVEEKTINGINQGYTLRVCDCEGEIFMGSFDNIVGLPIFLENVADFLQTQIREFYLAELVSDIKSDTYNLSDEDSTKSLLTNIVILGDYQMVLNKVQKALNKLKCEAK